MNDGPLIKCALQMPNQEHLFDHVKQNAPYAKKMLTEGMATGKRLSICGAGPSLNEYLDTLRDNPQSHEIWACNSALPYLMDKGVAVTHGFAIDQGIEMLNECEWQRLFDVTYLIASSVHPKLVEHLRDGNRRLRWFHNYLGIENPPDWVRPDGWEPNQPSFGYEMMLYQTLYTPSVQVGYGLNSVPRAMCLAVYMGFKSIKVYGADCAAKSGAPQMPTTSHAEYPAWLESVQLYADGRTALINGPQAAMVEGTIDGRFWHTRADMLITARHMVDLVRAFPDRIELVGDTLPNAIMHKDKEWFDAMPNLTGAGEISGFHAHNYGLVPEGTPGAVVGELQDVVPS